MSVLLSSKPASKQFNLGVELIGCYINLMLYSIAMLCTYIYRRSERAKRDPLVVKLLVAASAVVDTVGTFAVCASYFYFAVLGWGLDEAEYRANWSEPMWLVSTALSQMIAQTFIIRRYLILSRQYVVSALITVLMLFSLGANLNLAITSAINITALTLESRPSDLKSVLLSLSSTAAANLALAFVLIWKLRLYHIYGRIAHKIFSRTYAIFMLTGSAATMAALATLISFLADPLSALSTFFLSFVGRVYSLTMLFTLLYREMIVDDEWIQVDVSKADTMKSDTATISHGITETLPISNTPVSNITFANRNSPRISERASQMSGDCSRACVSTCETDSGSTLQVVGDETSAS